MNSIKEISPCFDKVTSVTDSKEFVQTFCMKALALLAEFKSAYGKAIAARNISDLDAVTHKIASTMDWLGLDDYVSIIKSYKNLNMSDQNAYEGVFVEVMHYTKMIEESIRVKLDEL